MIKRSVILLLILISPNFSVLSQDQIQFTHYTADEGLSENNVLSILQDHKGIMWFGTYDGLNKFDGYTFKTYKGNPENQFTFLNYRVDRIREDREGFLWVQTYDGRVYRFDTSKEIFIPIPQCIPEYKNYKLSLTGIYPLDDGSIWITGGDHGDNDCFRILNTKTKEQVQITHFSVGDRQLTSNKIKKIYLDKNQNTWILTSNGINLLEKNSSRIIQYFKQKEDQKSVFFSICENGSFVYFGGTSGKFTVYDLRKKTFENIECPFSSNIIDIKKINQNEFFILTDKSGFYIYNIRSKSITSFTKSNASGFKSDIFLSCYMDKHYNIWLDSENSKVVYFDTKSRKIENFNIKAEKASSFNLNFYVVEDNLDNVWVHPRSGGFSYFDKKSGKLVPFYDDPESSDRKFSNTVRTAFVDKQGNLWICPYTSGIEKIVFRKSPFNFYKPVPQLNYSEQNQIRSLFEDKDNWLWVGTKSGHLYIFDASRKLIGRLGTDGRMNSSVPFNVPVYNMMSDHHGNIWLGTKGKGIFKLNKSGNDKNATFSMINFKNNPEDVYSLSSDAVYSIFEDHMLRLWIATYGGGINLMEEQKGEIRFINNRNKLKNYPKQQYNRARFITEDQKGKMYIGTTDGLVAFQNESKAPENIKFYHYSHNPEDKFSISGNDIHYILPSKNGNLYLGIYGGGFDVFEKGLEFNKKPDIKVFKRENGISSDVVFTIQEDETGQVWLSTQTKLVKYDPKTEKFDTYNPLRSNPYSFIEASVCKTHSGDLVYGTTEGFIQFNPQKIKKSQFAPKIIFTQLQILNKPVNVGSKDSPLSKILDDTQVLELSHKQNILSISFSALDYSDPVGIQYAYKMEGIDVDWNNAGNNRIATYTNLPKGNFVFKVKSTNSEGEWVNNERSILVKKLPSFWESSWGFAFYFILFLSIIIVASYILFTIYRLKNDVLVEHRITDMKLRFFTDISHELRTPLTLIASPVENILRKEQLTDKIKEQLIVVKRNTDRMLRLVNQILDFHKIQNKKMKLEIEEIFVKDFITEICLNFKKLAEDRNIELSILDHSNNVTLWVDKDKFEKIFFNLLSNAFKFTRSGNTVDVIIHDLLNVVSISVKDKGTGIGKDKIKRIFNRFESFASNNSSPIQPSTGIGLSFTKELVELHKASIEVESELNKGSIFKVTFTKGHDHFSDNDDYILRDNVAETKELSSPVSPELENKEEKDPGTEYLADVPTILIVEDNTELRNFLSSVLRSNYNVLEAKNGEEALRMLPDSSPDLIVSDIMMPEMSGLELAKAVKEDINISHIPLVLLTAKNDIDSKLQAMEYGADDYITKPFSSAYLEARIENLLRIRKQLQEYYRLSLTSGVISISKPNVTSHDDQFMHRIMKYIEENIEDSELSIDGIASFLGLSRSSLFKKIKSLTGLAPVDFIKEVRIQRAAQLIETGEFNVSQVAYMIGMTDPRYFSKCFKQKFGVTPREYKDKCQP